MKKVLAIVLVAGLLLFCGCSGSGSDYFPLKVGNYWTYRTNFGPKLVIKVIRKEKVKDYDAYALESFVDVEGEDMPIRSNEDYYANTSQGILKVKRVIIEDRAEIFFEPPEVFLRTPLIPGKKWGWEGKQGDIKARFTCEVLGREKIHMMGREFDCIKVIRKGAPVDRKELEYQVVRWFVSGIGVVKEVARENGISPDGSINTVTSIFELMDYRVR